MHQAPFSWTPSSLVIAGRSLIFKSATWIIRFFRPELRVAKSGRRSAATTTMTTLITEFFVRALQPPSPEIFLSLN